MPEPLLHTVNGGCHCGNIRVQMQLTREPTAWAPRACDCDFCRRHGAAWISDPRGSLLIRIGDESRAGTYRQGSGTAEMLVCRTCGVLVGALYRHAPQEYAVVNVRVVDPGSQFAVERPISPKVLPVTERVRRWQEIWFSNVTLMPGHAPAAESAGATPASPDPDNT